MDCGRSAVGKYTPALRLAGRWMEELDFTIGDTLRITVRDGELVITAAGKRLNRPPPAKAAIHAAVELPVHANVPRDSARLHAMRSTASKIA